MEAARARGAVQGAAAGRSVLLRVLHGGRVSDLHLRLLHVVHGRHFGCGVSLRLFLFAVAILFA